MHAIILTLLLAGHAPAQTASDRAWARVSRIQSETHALTHRVHEFLPRDASWTAEDDALISHALDLRAAAKKLALDAAVAGRLHTERHPRTAVTPDRETVRLRLVELLTSALVAQLDVIQMAALDKPDERWRELLPPACALVEAILQEWREAEYSGDGR